MLSNNKRIAMNAVMLYIRMGIAMIVSLYTSRVVLNVLGASDFGVYNVVGGVVASLTFLNGAMSGATSRFLSFEIGKNDPQKLKATFENALFSHVILGLLVVIIAETIGLWFLFTKLVIPSDRLFAAQVIYQFSIFSIFISFVVVPFSADLISHEKMNMYAIFEIFRVVLKLILICSLKYFRNCDVLILYGSIELILGIILALIYIIYCKKHFGEISFKLKYDKGVLIPMLSYSGYHLFASFSVTAKTQGITFIINIFFGVIINAANAIVTSVTTVVNMLSVSASSAFRPHIIKLYAQGGLEDVARFINFATTITMVIVLVVTIPVVMFSDYILELWLVNPPEKTALFLNIMLIENIFHVLRINFGMGVDATGNVKKMDLLYGIDLLLVIPVSYMLVSFWDNPYVIYFVSLLSGFMSMIIVLYYLKQNIKCVSIAKTSGIILKTYLIFAISCFVVHFIKEIPSNKLLVFVLSCLLSTIMVMGLTFCFMNKVEKKTAHNIISRYIKR